jgi:ATP-dependent DNA helicase RecG
MSSTPEGQHIDRKSVRAAVGKSADWVELAKDCVAFANACGGCLLIGIEDGQDAPPPGQRLPAGLADAARRRLGELTVNVTVLPQARRTGGGDEWLELRIPRSQAVASTTDGRYFLRVADESKPVVGDDVLRLAAERSAWPWETLAQVEQLRIEADLGLQQRLLDALRASDRVKPSVKEKTDDELLAHYHLTVGATLTNLGVLCIGSAAQRARLGTAPVVQVIRYDELGRKIQKLIWDDQSQSPMDLVESVWREVPDFREQYELPDGLFRQHLPAYDEVVVRELVVNALVHRPYTQRGDIFLNLHPDRLEVVNPGRLPMGVTPRNVLHTTVRRNECLARLFHDLKLMEREGSGFDRMFEVLLSQGRPVPELTESHDRVQVTVRRRILRPEVIDFIAQADQAHGLTQRERIALGLLAQHDSMTGRELVQALELSGAEALQPWLKRLLAWGLVQHSGRTQATRYFVAPALLRTRGLAAPTTLQRIEPHRLAELVLEDLRRYPGSAIGDVHRRIGTEIHARQIKRTIDAQVKQGRLRHEGKNRWRRYWAKA